MFNDQDPFGPTNRLRLRPPGNEPEDLWWHGLVRVLVVPFIGALLFVTITCMMLGDLVHKAIARLRK